MLQDALPCHPLPLPAAGCTICAWLGWLCWAHPACRPPFGSPGGNGLPVDAAGNPLGADPYVVVPSGVQRDPPTLPDPSVDARLAPDPRFTCDGCGLGPFARPGLGG